MNTRIEDEKDEEKKENDGSDEEQPEPIDELEEQKLVGGFEADILGEKEEVKELVCPICLQIMRDAAETNCGHLFCEGCLKTWMKTNTLRRCPICKTKVVQHSSSFYFRSKISRLQARCKCGQVFYLKQLDYHQDVCKEVRFSQLSRRVLKDKKLLEARLRKHEQRLQNHDDMMGFVLMVGFGVLVYKAASKIYQWLQD